MQFESLLDQPPINDGKMGQDIVQGNLVIQIGGWCRHDEGGLLCGKKKEALIVAPSLFFRSPSSAAPPPRLQLLGKFSTQYQRHRERDQVIETFVLNTLLPMQNMSSKNSARNKQSQSEASGRRKEDLNSNGQGHEGGSQGIKVILC